MGLGAGLQYDDQCGSVHGALLGNGDEFGAGYLQSDFLTDHPFGAGVVADVLACSGDLAQWRRLLHG